MTFFPKKPIRIICMSKLLFFITYFIFKWLLIWHSMDEYTAWSEGLLTDLQTIVSYDYLSNASRKAKVAAIGKLISYDFEPVMKVVASHLSTLDACVYRNSLQSVHNYLCANSTADIIKQEGDFRHMITELGEKFISIDAMLCE